MQQTYGYIKTSNSQEIRNHQIKKLMLKYPEVIIVEEDKGKEDKLKALIEKLKSGDVLALISVSSFGNNMENAMNYYDAIIKKEVKLDLMKHGVYTNNDRDRVIFEFNMHRANGRIIFPSEQ